ncbi:MAG: 2-C-methyl-D-erythritol 2,4-cyclodiphosphate synthase [Phycisphaerales bacterium]|nr:2-C-methyl-D-erythritol 2,4-cyclodiphosphate synthase [Phycisphaerales bacterium]MCB9835374.1 2-C-methyl-D-erythritol 2,4-cyclodiphosphate synthase [Phycisphaera sp.]
MTADSATTDSPKPAYRIGHGYDLHRLEPRPPEGSGRPLILGAVEFEHDRGPVSHSDGDAVLHAVTDALLGAIGEPDIGQLFSDTDPRWEGASSVQFLLEATTRVQKAGYRVSNLDVTVILERPKLQPVKDRIRQNIARLIGIDVRLVNVKGKTHERVDAVGENRAVEVHAVVLLERA